MKSSASPLPELELPEPSPADQEALRRRPGAPGASPVDYLAFLAGFGDVDPAVLRARRPEHGPEAFTLV